MREHRHDTEDGFHEIQLSGKQLVFLFMVLTVASAVIFLTGVLFGRGVRTQQLEAMDHAATAAASSPAPASAPQPVVDTPPTTDEPPSPPTETPDTLSYHRRLQGESEPTEAVKPDAPPSRPARPESRGAETDDVPTGGRPGAWIVQVGAFGNADAARDVVKQLRAKRYPVFLVNPAPGMPAIYRVQVGAYDERTEADRIARRLEKEEPFKPVVRQSR